MFDKNKKIDKICDASNCNKEGIYPAPKSREQLNEYNFFCIDHIRDFNKSWNYFEGLNEEEFEREIRKSTTWDRPSWKFGTEQINENIKDIFDIFKKNYTNNNIKKINPDLQDAWTIIGLNPKSTIQDVKKKYKVLAKKWHPDTNLNFDKNKKSANERFVKITNAYNKIIKSFSNKKINITNS